MPTAILEPVLLGIGLAMDAFAVSIALGAAGQRDFTWPKIAAAAGSFGAFQMFMPILGWGGGTLFGETLLAWGHYIAPALLLGIGLNMIRETVKSAPDEAPSPGFGAMRLFVLSLATSIDALAVGVSYACRPNVTIVTDAAIIGVVTALISACGGIAGRRCGRLFGGKCGIFGAAILIGIAVKVFFFG